MSFNNWFLGWPLLRNDEERSLFLFEVTPLRVGFGGNEEGVASNKIFRYYLRQHLHLPALPTRKGVTSNPILLNLHNSCHMRIGNFLSERIFHQVLHLRFIIIKTIFGKYSGHDRFYQNI